MTRAVAVVDHGRLSMVRPNTAFWRGTNGLVSSVRSEHVVIRFLCHVVVLGSLFEVTTPRQCGKTQYG
jgi:hypothetical protein